MRSWLQATEDLYLKIAAAAVETLCKKMKENDYFVEEIVLFVYKN